MSRRTLHRAALPRLAGLCAVIAGLSVPGTNAVASPMNPRIEINHTTGDVMYKHGEISIKLDTPSPRTVPLRPGQALEIQVEKTNTLLYTYGQEVKEEDFVDKTALFKYLGGLQAGITELLALAAPPKGTTKILGVEVVRPKSAAEVLAESLEALREALAAVEEDTRTAARLESTYFEALQRTESEPSTEAGGTATTRHDEVETLLCEERKRTGLGKSPCGTPLSTYASKMRGQAWRNAMELENARKLAIQRKDEFAASGGAKDEPGQKALVAAAKALESVPAKALDLAREFAKLAVRFERLEKWLKEPATQYTEKPDSIRYQWDKSQAVTIAIEKRKDLADKIAYNERKFEKVTFVVSPEWYIQPSIGAGLIWADKLVWTEWTVLEAAGAKTVASKGMADKRFQFFPLLSLTSPALSCLASWHSEAENSSCDGWKRGKAVSLDLGWNASTSEPAYLVGGSFVFSRQFKIGGGVVWQRRQVLDGIEPGDPVPASGIPLRQSYSPAPYLMFSILGWPPFTSGQ